MRIQRREVLQCTCRDEAYKALHDSYIATHRTSVIPLTISGQDGLAGKQLPEHRLSITFRRILYKLFNYKLWNL